MRGFAQRFSTSTGKEKPAKPVAVLIRELDHDVNHEKLSHSERDEYLEQLKLYTRTAEEVAPLCTRQGILLLCKHGFDHGTAKTARTALKCLANVMLLAPKTRQLFVDLDYTNQAADLYTHDYPEDEFLAARILFLLTYGTDFDFNTLIQQKGLLDIINKNIARHATYYQTAAQKRGRQASVGDAASPVTRPSDLKALEAAEQLAMMSLGETLKLLFNLCTFYPSIKPSMAASLVPIFKILHKVKFGDHPLQPPNSYLINALLTLDFEGRKSDLFPSMSTKVNVDRLVQLLDLTLRREEEAEIERSGNPLIMLLRKIHEVAPKSIQAYMRSQLLPSEKDREKPLGQSDSLSSRLLNLTSSATAPTVAKSTQEFLFELSGKDASRFVRNIGYGFAAGFLMSHNMAVPENALEAWSSPRVEELEDDDEDEEDDPHSRVTDIDEIPATPSASASSSANQPTPNILVNPVTGQRRDMEDSDEEDTRSEDEKLREAERLFHLFERLRATGVVDVENPIATALREGRLE